MHGATYLLMNQSIQTALLEIVLAALFYEERNGGKIQTSGEQRKAPSHFGYERKV